MIEWNYTVYVHASDWVKLHCVRTYQWLSETTLCTYMPVIECNYTVYEHTSDWVQLQCLRTCQWLSETTICTYILVIEWKYTVCVHTRTNWKSAPHMMDVLHVWTVNLLTSLLALICTRHSVIFWGSCVEFIPTIHSSKSSFVILLKCSQTSLFMCKNASDYIYFPNTP